MDHCTMFFEGWWGRCCEIHDIAYGMGWNKASADFDLFMCVASTDKSLLSAAVGVLMFAGVAAFGRFFYPRKTTKT